MEQRANFLALMLLDALEDENKKDIFKILERNCLDASYVTRERGIAPIHYVCGMSNETLALNILKQFLAMGADPNVTCVEKMTPLHIAAIYGRVGHVRALLAAGARLDLSDDNGKLAVHYAIEECHVEVFEVMRDHIFCDKFEEKKKQSLGECKFRMELSENTRTSTPNEERALERKANVNDTPKSCQKTSLLRPNQDVEGDKYTPNRIHYNYDTTSPYYIHITHRRHKPQPKYLAEGTINNGNQYQTPPPECVNIFSLTKENLNELNVNSSKMERSRISLIETWRSKVDSSRARQSLFPQYQDIENFVEQVMNEQDFNIEHQTKVTGCRKEMDGDSGAESLSETPATPVVIRQKPTNHIAFNEVVQQVAAARIVEPPSDQSFHTACDVNVIDTLKPPPAGDTSRSQLIRSPKTDEYFLQMTEAYVHTDDENGLVFYETKLLNNLGNKVAHQSAACPATPGTDLNSSATTLTTNHTLPFDYETDELRAELTQFGERVGPITKGTKRLYIKRLIKYKRRNTTQLAARSQQNAATTTELLYSVELQRTLRTEHDFEKIPAYFTFETTSAAHFATGNASVRRQNHQLREGHLKQSFIYMLIDPRISCNLPGESAFLDKYTLWRRFLEAIFYVGKGKSTRPYAHLYDAMKTHTRAQQAQQQGKPDDGTEINNKIIKKKTARKQQPTINSFKSPTPVASKGTVATSQKLARILEIWSAGQGVVCLHVFHNIIPTDAYTREAAIIDAMGLRHLTNMKRGDYYGPAQTWTMKEKKYFGIALLYKALHIFLAEGESQLSPSDLI